MKKNISMNKENKQNKQEFIVYDKVLGITIKIKR